MSLKRNGDLLERVYFDFINQNIPTYVQIWEDYIVSRLSGNLSEKEQKINKEFAEYHYTILESLVCLNVLLSKIDEKTNLGEIKEENINKYIELINNFMLFYSHLGRIRDLVHKIGNLFGDRMLSNDLDEYYKQRNIVLHDKKIPFSLLDGVMVIPLPNGKEDYPDRWNDQKTWKDFNDLKIEFMADFMKETFRTLLINVNNALAKVYSFFITPICQKCKAGTEIINRTFKVGNTNIEDMPYGSSSVSGCIINKK